MRRRNEDDYSDELDLISQYVFFFEKQVVVKWLCAKFGTCSSVFGFSHALYSPLFGLQARGESAR